MRTAALYSGALVAFSLLTQVSGSTKTIIAQYGGTIVVPCNTGAPNENIVFTKWKYDSRDGLKSGDLLVKQTQKEEVNIQATGSYKDRVSLGANSSLLIARATLDDQALYTCMEVSVGDIKEYKNLVMVYKRPTAPEMTNKATQLENGKLVTLAECIARDANPPANITWSKNGKPLLSDGKTVVITVVNTTSATTGLSTVSAKLQYAAVKEDGNSIFTCTAQHSMGPDQLTQPEKFIVTYPTEKVELQLLTPSPFKEGDNITFKCKADGNPPPTAFYFHLKGNKVKVENNYTLQSVARHHSGDYKCSLVSDEKMEDTKSILVNYLDVALSPSGKITKNVGDSLLLSLQHNATEKTHVAWTKDNGKLDKQPEFGSLKYGDSGLYVCTVTSAGITQSRSFQLLVEGVPRIRRLYKTRSEDGKHKVLTCEAEGSPKPSVQWNVNGTHEESTYINGRVTHKITVVPIGNLTVTCIVTNKLGEDVKSIDLESLIEEETNKPEDRRDDEDDKAKLIVGIVVGLILAAAVVGLAYWIYNKNTKQGSWKTGEKESGTLEESKKLEETNHKQEV